VPLQSRTSDLVAGGLVAAMLVASALTYPDLPATLAVQFGGDGSVTNSLSKPVGAVVVPAVTAGAVVLSRVGQRLGLASGPPESADLGVVLVGVVGAYAHGLVLLWNLGTRFDPLVAVLPLAVLVVAVVAYRVVGGGRPF
jgi:uncharacterized membrane protein